MKHKHCVIRAEVNKPIINKGKARKFLRSLIKKIDLTKDCIKEEMNQMINSNTTHFKMTNTGSEWKSWNFSKSPNRKISKEQVRANAREKGLFGNTH